MPENFPPSGQLGQEFGNHADPPAIEPELPPTTSELFAEATEDKLKGKPSKPDLTLTPDGARETSGSNRRTVAEKGINPSQIPSTPKVAELPRKEQFNRVVGRHYAKIPANDNQKGRNVADGRER